MDVFRDVSFALTDSNKNINLDTYIILFYTEK